MPPGNKGKICLWSVLLLGTLLSVLTAWSLQIWTEDNAKQERLRAAEAWGHRVHGRVQASTSAFALSASIFAELDEPEPALFQSLVATLIETTAVTGVAWGYEIRADNLRRVLESNPGLEFFRPVIADEVKFRERIFVLGLLAGEPDFLRLGLELLERPELSLAVDRVLESAELTPAFLRGGEMGAEGRLLYLVPIVVRSGEDLGLILAEVPIERVIQQERGDDVSSLQMELWSEYPLTSSGTPLWTAASPAQQVLLDLPLPLGQDRWTMRIVAQPLPRTLAPESALVGLIGLLLTLTLAGYSRHLFSTFDRNVALAKESISSLQVRERDYQDSLQKLRNAEERYRDLFEKSQALIWTQDEEGRILSINPASALSLGYSLDEMLTRSLKDFIIPTERHTFPQYVERSRTQDTSKGLLKLYTKNGATRFWMYQTSRLLEDGTVLIRCHALDVTESHQAERELERLSRRNELILESVGDGIYGINLAGECTFVNPAALRHTGHSREELIKAVHTMHEILQPERADASKYPWEDSPSFATLNDGEIRRVSGEFMWRKDGSKFPVEYVVTPIVEDDERILGAVVTFQDVTERKAVEKMKNEFISIVSHELRTPLTSIRGSLGLLASGLLTKFPDKAEKMLKIAVENTDRLVRLINDILDIERLESGKVSIEQQECDLSELMKGATETMQAMANNNGVQLALEPLEEKVWADSDRVLQVLTNLLSNAIKFSESGKMVTLRGHSSQPGWVRIDVVDQGRGIPSEKISNIFERFGQVDASDSREKGGTGLGLPICRTIVEQHKGRLWVESTLGEGSTFSFTLPTEPPEPSPTEAESPTAAAASSR